MKEAGMPLVRLTVARGLGEDHLSALGEAIHRALVTVANVPADDRFQIVEEVPPERLAWSPRYLGIEHRAPLAFVQVFMNVGRTVEVKKALFAALADAVAGAAPIRREDVIVNLVEVAKENWSFGGGVMSYPPTP
jgi:phenylpyruvate tautomerase PptA (4-oxalocrotonate tautomerase family)